MNNNFRKLSAAVLVLGFILFSAMSLSPVRVNAQMATASTTVADVPKQVESLLTRIKNAILNALKYSMTNAVLTASDTAAQRIAANAATYIVSGGNGKSPLAYITGWNNWHDNILADSVSDSINTLSTKYLGFGICAPLNLSLDLRIKLGVARLYAPKPSCTAAQAYKSYEQTKSNIQSGQFLSGMKVNFEMGTSGLSVALNTQYAIVNQALNSTAAQEKQRSTSPFKPLTDKISGNIKTPASMIEDVAKTPKNEQEKADALKKQVAITNMDLWAAVGTNALKIFTSTLMSKAIDKYLKGGVLSGKDLLCASSAGKSFDLCKGVVNETVAAGTASGTTDAALASAYFAALFTPPVNQIDDYSPLGDLSSCPGKEARGIWNCVMDQGFVSALSAQDDGYLSVADAIKKPGMLNGGWQLIPPNDTRNSDPNCYTQGFCYSNLIKLRRMRIIPVGWELAAEAAAKDSSPITLQGAINAFNDKSSKYYHLIDPDWILKLPVTQCKAQVYGQTLAAANTSERGQVCVDAPSCISEDGNGNCTGGYGYCTRERSVWQIDATSCPVQYASCDSFTDTKGKNLSVLKNTVDYGKCDVTNAGCRPYVAVGDATGNFADGQPSAYLNSQAPDCDATNAGCRSLDAVKSASTANLIPNPSLETTTADGAMAAGWHSLGAAYEREGVNSFDGIGDMHVSAAGGLKLGGYNYDSPTDSEHYSEVQVQPDTLYTVSFYAKGAGAGSLIMKAFDGPFYGTPHQCTDFVYTDGSGNHPTGPFSTCLQDMTGDVSYTPTCSTTGSGNVSCSIIGTFDFGVSVNNGAFNLAFPLSSGYERYTMTFSTGRKTGYLDFAFGGSDYYLDAVQLEKGSTATAFHVGGSDNAGLNVDIKAPPAYLGCTGETTDPAACASYALVCRQSEVGCDAFTPTAGGTAVTAVTSSNDACPNQCVGYSTFKQEPTRWNTARFPLYFIPSTARSCGMAQVGCDEFTDLAASANGGESKAYFTYIRACRQPDSVSDGNYFTWEGSDASGYQLQSYVLVNRVSADNTMIAAASVAGSVVNVPKSAASAGAPGPVYLSGTNLAGCSQDIYQGANGAVKNPDCREFIDADGNIFYRLLSATITATTDCKSYRKTLSSQAECQGSGGVWDDGSKTCDYFTYPAQSVTCPASLNGCRAFTGNQGNNVQTLFVSDFESGNLDSWTNGTVSSESTTVGQHSYTLTNGVASRSLANIFASGSSIVHQGRSYTLVVWAKGTGKLNAFFNAKNLTAAMGRSNYFADAANINTAIQLSSEWQRYELGPVIATWAPDAADTLILGANNGSIYFDNVELHETQDQFALVAGSWKTPAVCDQTSAGQSLPQAQLNCSQYASAAAGNQVNLKSFDHLCRSAAVGCEAFTDTQETATPFASFNNAVCAITTAVDFNNSRDCLFNGQTACSVAPGDTSCRFSFDGGANQLGTFGTYKISAAADTFVIPPDSTEYLINDGNHSCDAASVGCTAFGDNDLNTLDASKHRVPWKVNGKTVYKIINPDNLKSQLCTQDTVSCTEWTTPTGDKSYFKDPGDALCEYKDKATYKNNAVSGWFKKGTTEPCDPNFVIGGTAMGIRKNLDTQFAPDNFAGVCPSEQTSCTEFTDHADPGKVILPAVIGAECQYQTNPATSACQSTWCYVDATTGAATNQKCTVEFASGRPFYYINDSKITDATAACSNQGGLQVSQKKGCLLLNQTDNPQKNYDTVATYAASEAAGFALVPPVSNPGDSTVTPAKPPTNDANIILKVTRDRVCSEWLECNTEQTVTDPTTGRDSTRCLSVASCLQKGADGRCLQWGQLETGAAAKLDATYYAKRNVTSTGNDFSGFSIPDQMPVATFTQSDSTSLVLTTGGTPSTVSQTCKAYPEADAPFPKSVLVDTSSLTSGSRVSGYNSANVCEGADCECSYRKAVYGTVGNRYFPKDASTGTTAKGTKGDIPDAICSGGKYDGLACNPLAIGNRDESTDNLNLSCDSGASTGECTAFTKVDSLLGQEGYCLEHDTTLQINGSAGQNACITWLPVDSVQGQDTSNQFLTAAFIPKINQERYCSAPAKYCQPRDCANGPATIPICTLMQNVNFDYNSATPVSYENVQSIPDATNGGYTIHHNNGCFQTCHGQACETQQSTDCDGLISKFCNGDSGTGTVGIYNINCSKVTQAVPGCQVPDTSVTPATTKVNPNDPYCQRLLSQCTDYLTHSIPFCDYFEKEGVNHDVQDSGYGHEENAASYAGSWCGSYNGSGATGYSPYSDYDYHGHTLGDIPAANYDLYDPTRVAATKGAAYTISDCASAGTTGLSGTINQFCTGDTDCGSGLSCLPVNDLSVNQTEYTEEESNEQLTYNLNDVPFSTTNVLSYPTIPGYKTYFKPGLTTVLPAPQITDYVGPSHTFFGGAANSFGLPVLSSPALKFVLSKDGASGDLLTVNSSSGCPDGSGGTTAPCFPTNINPLAQGVGSSRMNPYPNDLIGLYRYGTQSSSGSITADYDLVEPKVLLTGQIDRVTVKLLSNGNDGLCQYYANQNGSDYISGTCAKKIDNLSTGIPAGFQTVTDNTYGYLRADGYQNGDDENFSGTGAAYLVLTAGNNWSSEITSNEGSFKVTLRLSDNNPSRVQGVTVNATDLSQRGYTYLQSFDVALNGRMCGLATYIGSSNPFADPFVTPATGQDFAPVAYTNSVNAKKDYVLPIGKQIAGTPSAQGVNQCTPWGAFTTTSPPGYVNEQTDKTKTSCQLNQGTLYSSQGDMQQLFARGWSGQYNDASKNFDIPGPGVQPYPVAANPPPAPTIDLSNLTINNVQASPTAFVYGTGSVRATLNFFAQADKDHMPIRSVKINWGDGTTLVDPGNVNFYKNHIAPAVNGTGGCSGANFATVSPDACTTDPFKFTHVYSCTNPVSLAGSRAFTVAQAAGANTGCTFTPTITIIDNWKSTGTSDSSVPQVVVSP